MTTLEPKGAFRGFNNAHGAGACCPCKIRVALTLTLASRIPARTVALQREGVTESYNPSQILTRQDKTRVLTHPMLTWIALSGEVTISPVVSANTVRLEEVEDESRGAFGVRGTSAVAVVTVDMAFAGHRDALHGKERQRGESDAVRYVNIPTRQTTK